MRPDSPNSAGCRHSANFISHPLNHLHVQRPATRQVWAYPLSEARALAYRMELARTHKALPELQARRSPRNTQITARTQFPPPPLLDLTIEATCYQSDTDAPNLAQSPAQLAFYPEPGLRSDGVSLTTPMPPQSSVVRPKSC
jgi:hypothetical protein